MNNRTNPKNMHNDIFINMSIIARNATKILNILGGFVVSIIYYEGIHRHNNNGFNCSNI
jgi:hypothetical protein